MNNASYIPNNPKISIILIINSIVTYFDYALFTKLRVIF